MHGCVQTFFDIVSIFSSCTIRSIFRSKNCTFFSKKTWGSESSSFSGNIGMNKIGGKTSKKITYGYWHLCHLMACSEPALYFFLYAHIHTHSKVCSFNKSKIVSTAGVQGWNKKWVTELRIRQKRKQGLRRRWMQCQQLMWMLFCFTVMRQNDCTRN